MTFLTSLGSLFWWVVGVWISSHEIYLEESSTTTFEELNTLSTDVEATLNSYPIVATYSPPQDCHNMLTTEPFLIRSPLKSLPISVDLDVTVSLQRT